MNLLWLNKLSLSDVKVAGGKAANTGELFRMGANAVNGFVVPPDFDIDKGQAEIETAFDKLGSPTVAVRSSATAEDGKDFSFAGQFETYLHITKPELVQKIKDCRNSAGNKRVQAYLQENKIDHQAVQVAVIVQAMVIPEVTGVAFTKNPLSGDENEIMIEAVWGLGEKLVSGEMTPDMYVCTKQGEILETEVTPQTEQHMYVDKKLQMIPVPPDNQDKPKLTEQQIIQLAEELKVIEQNFGYPIDVEWIYAGQKFYIMQARPITT